MLLSFLGHFRFWLDFKSHGFAVKFCLPSLHFSSAIKITNISYFLDSVLLL